VKARIFGTLFLLVVLGVLFVLTQDGSSSSRETYPTQVQSSPTPSSSDNDMKSLKIN
jgi:hypothetical protein